MKMSLKIAIIASIVWFAFVWQGAESQLDYLDASGSALSNLFGMGITIIWVIYFLFRKNIDAKFGD